mmetsp:Transcript_6980/g.12558  ORF Transcript_6980/g.12558 Transcript_6980/m.12558 type:complete len:238 (-) Transcript_6980:449-1162(-)
MGCFQMTSPFSVILAMYIVDFTPTPPVPPLAAVLSSSSEVSSLASSFALSFSTSTLRWYSSSVRDSISASFLANCAACSSTCALSCSISLLASAVLILSLSSSSFAVLISLFFSVKFLTSLFWLMTVLFRSFIVMLILSFCMSLKMPLRVLRVLLIRSTSFVAFERTLTVSWYSTSACFWMADILPSASSLSLISCSSQRPSASSSLLQHLISPAMTLSSCHSVSEWSLEAAWNELA